ncbi:MAG TPA: helix-turn-helix domain-containing protein [Aggregatilineales bacterium]|nr:helix-turn-helix domain-containing protein [Aggregatilineales bacterium]
MTEQIKSATGKTEYKSYGLDCPIARTLDVIGDRWTLLIIRDLLRGTHKYQDLLDSLTGISTNLLAERLARLVDEGLVARTLYTEKPPRAEYHLTEQGQELGAVVDALFEWGTQWRGWGQAPELRTMREYLIRELGLRPEDVREVSEQRTKRTRGLFRA